MKELKYPVDSSNLRNIRERGFVYVDKTEFIYRLISKGTYYFLARPRRFGKSLFLDTLAEYFNANRNLFKGLAIDRLHTEEWQSYPVLRFNLSKMAYENPTDLLSNLGAVLSDYENAYDLEESDKIIYYRFENLIRTICKKTGKKVVILIDEYDAPLSSSIDKPELLKVYREQLQGFYSVLKGAEEYIKFCFLTGVTRFGKVSIFSGLNNLNDITFDNRFAAICGITREELVKYYDEGIAQFAKSTDITKEKAYELLKFHYDGYHFSESLVDIYNPYSINHALNREKLEDYWCRSGVPTILSKSLLENDFDIEEIKDSLVEESTLADLSIHATNPIPLLYQTGYLTLKTYDPVNHLFSLGYPNREVEKNILNNILTVYNPNNKGVASTVARMKQSLREGNPKDFIKILSSFLSSIPNQLREYVSKYENYYHTIFYCLTSLIGLDVNAEFSTSEGFIDMLIKTEEYIYVIELKVNGSAEDAIRQINNKHYCAPFESEKLQIFKIGIGFSKETGTISSSKILGETPV